jgi:hypothetical protein
MELLAAGVYRRTRAERDDQRLSWSRPDRAFFASGACHILAWACRELHPDRPIDLAALRTEADDQVFHVFAAWSDWAFDHSGWHLADDLVSVNQEFLGEPLLRVDVGTELARFCAAHHHRMPDQYHADPRPRARAYVRRFPPPWS